MLMLAAVYRKASGHQMTFHFEVWPRVLEFYDLLSFPVLTDDQVMYYNNLSDFPCLNCKH